MSHSAPNQANIPAVFHGEPKNAVEDVKDRYDGEMRSCFTVPGGRWLVGCDADGIQLRILAHYMKSEAYVKAITEGNKDDETDIHNLNKRALGPICRTRDHAKTFIYAHILGASTPKVAEILETNNGKAKQAEDNFLAALPELKRVREVDIKRDAMRGYFIGLDGRKVPCLSEHLMLAGYLQNGESVAMKRATVLWYNRAIKERIKFKLVDFVHDEWQVEVDGTKEDAERLGKIMCEALEQVGEDLDLYCPLAGSYVLGKDWRETH